jgi:hypothetical protein
MPINYGNDYEYAHAKVSGSIVKFNDRPVMVHSINSEGALIKFMDALYMKSEPEQSSKELVPLAKLDFSSFPLGYVNCANNCLYVTRIPHRNWKQGIRSANLAAYQGSMVSIGSAEFINMLLNNYPKLGVCIESLLCGEIRGKAFSRRFALSTFDKSRTAPSRLQLIYKDIAVGVVELGDYEKIKLHDEFEFLKESLEEEMQKND